MSVKPVNTVKPASANNKWKYQSVKYTGYGAVALGVASGIAGSRKKIKLHKNLAYASALLTAAHVGIIEWFHHKSKSAK